MGKFWSCLWELMDTQLKESTSFHPHRDEQTEVVNKTVVHLLRGYCGKHTKMWDEQFPYVQYAYNCGIHSSTLKTLFEIRLVYLPRSPLDFSLGEKSEDIGKDDADKARNFIQRIQQIHKVVQE